MWCTDDGQLPPTSKDNPDEASLLSELISDNAAHRIKTHGMAPHDMTSCFASSVFVYKMSMDSSELAECDAARGKTCEARHDFLWAAERFEESAKAAVICTNLGENICGDYGIQLLIQVSYTSSTLKRVTIFLLPERSDIGLPAIHRLVTFEVTASRTKVDLQDLAHSECRIFRSHLLPLDDRERRAAQTRP